LKKAVTIRESEESVKYLYFLALATVIPSAAPAQILPDPSGLSVIKKQWSMTRITPHNSVLLEDPFDAIDESNRANREQKTILRENKVRALKGLPTDPSSMTTEPPPRTERSLKASAAYIYQLRLRNDGAKTIRNVVWEYVFLDPASGEEVGRHRFVSRLDLRPRETGGVKMRLISPPTGAVDARTMGKKPGDIYVEQIIIRSVMFADGTVWQPELRK
jgi:hypothetical protein